MTAPPATTAPIAPEEVRRGAGLRARAGRPPKIKNRARWGLYVNADHRRRGEERAAKKGHGDYTDVLRSLMAAYAAGKLDSYATTQPGE